MSLADELLADLEEGGEEEIEQVGAEASDAVADIDDVGTSAMEVQQTDESVRSVAKLLHSDEVWIKLNVLRSFITK